jgi:ATP-dependent DNA helicase RecQ
MTATLVLEHIVQYRQAPSWFHPDENATASGIDRALARLATSLESSDFGIDQAILLRQCLRMLDSSQRVVTEPVVDDVRRLLERVCVYQSLDGTVAAAPFLPDWLGEDSRLSVDLPAPRFLTTDRAQQGEPWLAERLGMRNWKSEAQRDAAWRALRAPENSSLLVGLPTGAGKSLVYQCCVAFESGLTVLIVPTVALGIDQLEAVKLLPFANTVQPLLYGDTDEASDVIQAVRSGQCRLLIASPEAVVAGHLRPLLEECAADGRLRRLIIDEAHIVESWGADFRIEFQLLGALLRDWRRTAPNGIRLLLLSATFSPKTPRMLRTLFSSEGDFWEERVVQRLRSEIHYSAPPTWLTAAQQIDFVLEALHNLPRPAILYVTEKKKAEQWLDRLRELGFNRVASFHGDTPRGQRNAIMWRWRQDELDLVVATSAFGMGVNKQDVRAVVHACYPEGIDRFYQEVGRGGRDGAPSISLLMPTKRDSLVARTMGPRLLRDEDKVNGRWLAMWSTREHGAEDDEYRIRIDTQPEYRLGIRSFSENVRWNKRLLLMMERARLIRIAGIIRVRKEDDADPTEYAVVQVMVPTVELQYQIAKKLQAQRSRELKSIDESLERLSVFFRRERPICRQLRDQYGPDTLRACGSCFQCREGKLAAQVGGDLVPADAAEPIAGPLVHVVQCPSVRNKSGETRVIQVIRFLMQAGIVMRFVVSPTCREFVRRLIDRADDRSGLAYRLDDLTPGVERSISPDEFVVMLHIDEVVSAALPLNRRGKCIAHWILGSPIESTPGRWAFMYESGSRSFPGPEGLNHWLADVSSQRRIVNTRPVQNVHG